jgi:hypothetical protein
MQIVRLARRRAVADEIYYYWFASRARSAQQPVSDLSRGWFGDEDEYFGGRIAAEEIEALVRRNRAHGLREVTPACAQGMGDTAAQLMDARADLLQSRT